MVMLKFVLRPALSALLFCTLLIASSVVVGHFRTGEVIVVVMTTPQRADYRIQLIDVELGLRRIIDPQIALNDVVLSPDGRYALLLPSRSNVHVRVLDLKSGRTHRIQLNDLVLTTAWSPDNGALLINLNSESTDEHALYATDLETGKTRRLVSAADEPLNGVWSPDSRQLAYVRNGMLLTINLQDSSIRALSSGSTPLWSPDGTMLAFSQAGVLHVVNLDDGLSRRLAEDYSRAVPVNWSPDSQWLAFYVSQGSRSDRQEIPYTVNIQTGEVHRFDVPAAAFVRSMHWSPDSTRLAVVTESLNTQANQSRSTLYTADPTGQNPRTITRNGYHPAWSPDGSQLLYQAWELISGRSQNRLYWVNLNTDDEPRVLVTNVLYPQWSADGQRYRYILYEPFSTRAALYSASFGGSARLLTTPDEFVRSFAAWR